MTHYDVPHAVPTVRLQKHIIATRCYSHAFWLLNANPTFISRGKENITTQQ